MATFKLNDEYTFSNGSSFITSGGSDNTPASLSSANGTDDQNWNQQTSLSNGQLYCAAGFFLTGVAEQTPTCPINPPDTFWVVTDNGDDTVILELMINNASIGALENDNGSLKLKPKNGGNTQKWKFNKSPIKGPGHA
ncbi:MAG: hypothetical protein CFE21_16770 [Bacteroidetes bacterium B1(2017)]|nr:MAG: hypothetical protein CFE21_16770 [Bacteroidetes bacterium B1(2017)]